MSTRAPQSFWLSSDAGVRARVIDFGATLVSLEAPDRSGRVDDVVLGFDDPARYCDDHPNFGSTVGRFANRIANARFELDGATYELSRNHGAHHLHGGERGFGRVFWEGRSVETAEGPGVELHYRSPDGDEGYPGSVDATVTYALSPTGELRITFEAVTDAPTVVNLSHHSYFHLGGAGSGDVLDHELWLAASRFTPCDPDLIPDGTIAPVAGTPMDFRVPRQLRGQLAPLLHRTDDLGPRGLDHNFVLDPRDRLAPAARLRDPASGRQLEVETTQPGLQVYTANHLDGTIRGKADQSYHPHAAICLETQHFPDSPNRPTFPSTRLSPGGTYRHTSVYNLSSGTV